MSNLEKTDLPTLRRIVTTHDAAGKSTVQFDDEVATKEGLLPGIRTGPIWITTDSLPTNDTNNDRDGGKRTIADATSFHLIHPTGTNFRTSELGPGVAIPMHRTSSLDYSILLAGELVHITEDAEQHIKTPGDVVIQKGTLHGWRNPSPDRWARWITVLMAAEPAIVNGKELLPMFGEGSDG